MYNLQLEYLPIATVANIYGVSEKSIKSLFYNASKINSVRFRNRKNRLFVTKNYINPLHDIVYSKYTEALNLASNENKLIDQLSNMSGIKKGSIFRTLYRLNFTHFDTAIKYMILLNNYIELQNKIEKLYIEALNYTNDIDLLCKSLAYQTGLKLESLKSSLLNDSNKINIYHLKTILEIYTYQQQLLSKNIQDKK